MPRRHPDSARTLPYDLWPAEDRCAWEAAIHAGSVLRDAGRGVHWKPPTRQRYLWCYGHFLHFLIRSGRFDPALSPADRLTTGTLVDFVESLKERDLASRTLASAVQAIHNAAWGMFPGADLSQIKILLRKLMRQARPVKDHQARIFPIDQVYAAAIREMRSWLRRRPRRQLQDAVRFRDALMIAFLCAAPLRRRNLAETKITHNLTRAATRFCLYFPAAEVKNGEELEAELPGSLTPWLDHYLQVHRPRLLLGRTSQALWIRADGSDFTVNTVNSALWKATTRLGFPMRAHDFRTAAATSIATISPGLTRSIRQILGHRIAATAEHYYNKARMIEATRRYAGTLTALRNQSREPPA